MYKNLRWKALTIFAVLVLFSGIGVYPLLAQRYNWPLPGWLHAKALKLGLDLKGGVQLDLKVNTITGPATLTTIGKPNQQTPAATAGASKVKLYTTTWCGYCKRAKAYLQARGTPFQEIDVETSAQGQREFQALGGRGVPVILVGNQRMDGYSEGTLAGMLKQAGL